MTDHTRHPASYKDPSGFIFHASGKFYRQVNKIYAGHYELLIRSGLSSFLQEKNLLLPHEEVAENILHSDDWYLTLLPEQVPFTSYPYEWCFEQLKDAALLTLEIVKLSIDKGMILKDATPYNVQFLNRRPVFIDTLSFEKYDPSLPWTAYRQFCESFLFPLLLSHYHKTSIQPFLNSYPNGIPVNITAKLLPWKSRLNPGVWLHVFLQNKLSKKTKTTGSASSFSKNKLLNLISHLDSIIRDLSNTDKTEWSNYYTGSISSRDYLGKKEVIISNLLQKLDGRKLLDLGANEGFFSCLATAKNFDVIAIDKDEQCINILYKKVKEENITNILPLCMDLMNPSPASGFANNERASFGERIRTDAVMALALIHHLAIGYNLPLSKIAEYLYGFSDQLIIEFVPKEDEKVQLLLQNKKDIYPQYTREHFENIFRQRFTITEKVPVPDSDRIIYLMKKIAEI
jgi:Tellurite resistance protein TehB